MNTAQDRWGNHFPTAWEGRIPGDDRQFRAVRVDDKTVIAQVLSGEKWLNLGDGREPSERDTELSELVMEQAVADIGAALTRAVSKRKFRVYCYDRSPAFLQELKAMGIESDTVVELTPEQVLDLSIKVAVMVTPSTTEDNLQLLRLDVPRWCFKQR